ncbi:sulfite exporter TauE/SafE family protein [Chloroflexota bacterium]
MLLTHAIILLLTGGGVGFFVGLLSVGGFVMTPVQLWVYGDMEVPADIAIRMAFGANLFVLLPTVVSSALGHHRKGAVWWKAAAVLGICGFFGAYGGATSAAYLPSSILKVVFGVILLGGGIRMLVSRSAGTSGDPRDSIWLWVAWGLPIGIISGLIGIGGGVLMVPVMILALRFRIHEAVGTAAAVMITTCIGGLIGYIVNGWGVEEVPSPNLGYIYIWAWLALTIPAAIMAQIGARTAHRIPSRQLRWLILALMFYISLRMIGLFAWLNLPI